MVFFIFLLSILTITDGVPFSHNIDFEHPESGERVKLQSMGQLTNAVDLDRIEGIKVNKGNNKITELQTILQRESQNS